MIMVVGFLWQTLAGPSEKQRSAHYENLANQIQQFRHEPAIRRNANGELENDELNEALANALQESRENGKDTSKVTTTGNAGIWAIFTVISWVLDRLYVQRKMRLADLR
jgi:hypothetical protein